MYCRCEINTGSAITCAPSPHNMMEQIDIKALIERLAQKASSQEITVYKTPSMNDRESTLGGYDCKTCNNRGVIVWKNEDGLLTTKECECMEIRRSLRRLRKSGVMDMLKYYTFKNYETPDEWTFETKETALRYLQNGEGKWFYISGRPGSGKTHICTAICGQLLRQGKSVQYILWRDITQKLKAVINEQEYQEEMRQLADIDVLYIDDFLKGTISEADMNRAFEIINCRYIRPGKRTILSSERNIEEVISYDEAVGSRIRERARDYTVIAQDKNWRLT